MRYETEKQLAARAKALGDSAAADALPDLLGLCQSASPLARRLAASAIGKLAGIVDAGAAVAALKPMLGDVHPQVRQYAAKALGTYGLAAESALPALRDMLRNPVEADYVKRSVTAAGLAIKAAMEIAARQRAETCRLHARRQAPDLALSRG